MKHPFSSICTLYVKTISSTSYLAAILVIKLTAPVSDCFPIGFDNVSWVMHPLRICMWVSVSLLVTGTKCLIPSAERKIYFELTISEVSILGRLTPRQEHHARGSWWSKVIHFMAVRKHSTGEECQ